MHPEESFSFNNDFSSGMQKIKISTVSSRVEDKEERKGTRDRIDEERKHQMEVFWLFKKNLMHCDFLICSVSWQACIVRIMKDRKHMNHNGLVHEVTQQLTSKFIPEPLAIKKRVEHLIEVSKIPLYIYIAVSSLICPPERVS